jgi:hypothetical protein
MYADVWEHYSVPGETGLFTENYPSKRKDILTYMQGGGVQEKAVSFLWPFSGMFSATNVLLKIPAVHKKYLPYLDTLATGMEKYKDTSRSPAGYQAYPVKFEKRIVIMMIMDWWVWIIWKPILIHKTRFICMVLKLFLHLS